MKRGYCLCGRITWEYSGAETWACYCHCDDCRRNCSSPVVAYIGVELDRFKWTGQIPKVYASSKGIKRHFCNKCGTPMAFEAEHYAGEIHLYAASLDDPENFKSAFHVHTEEKLSWLQLEDDLPKHAKSAT